MREFIDRQGEKRKMTTIFAHKLLKVIVEYYTRIKHINNAAMAFIRLPSSEPEYDLNLSPID